MEKAEGRRTRLVIHICQKIKLHSKPGERPYTYKYNAYNKSKARKPGVDLHSYNISGRKIIEIQITKFQGTHLFLLVYPDYRCIYDHLTHNSGKYKAIV